MRNLKVKTKYNLAYEAVFVSGLFSEESTMTSEIKSPAIMSSKNPLESTGNTGEPTTTVAGRIAPDKSHKRPMEPLRSSSKRSKHLPKHLLEYKL